MPLWAPENIRNRMTTQRSNKDTIVVLGGGLTGLSTLWHLQKAGYDHCHLFEKESRVGGLTRSEQVDGFTFDHTGHLLHFRNEQVKQLVSDLLGDNLHTLVRDSWIFSKGVYTRYPFQTNLYGLPAEVIKECILSFIQASSNRANGHSSPKPRPSAEYSSFAEWIEATLGTGIARHFMVPYNEKLWTLPLNELTCEWMGRFVPATSLEQIIDGALIDQSRRLGYNATFSYPLRGGIEALPRAFAASLQNIHTGHELVRLDLQRKQVCFGNGESMSYDQLVTTIPLHSLLRAATAVPAPIREASQRLRFTSVYNINLGVNRNLSEKHWVYFPEPEYCFYRVGFSHNFSLHQVPAGCGAIYAEVAYAPWKPLDKSQIVHQVKADLLKAGILAKHDQVLAECCLDIPCAYVIYDRNYRKSVEELRGFARENDIYTIGRYGAWEYSGMEDAIWQGKQVADEILA
jgi:protoporphyrinogen oxidase